MKTLAKYVLVAMLVWPAGAALAGQWVYVDGRSRVSRTSRVVVTERVSSRSRVWVEPVVVRETRCFGNDRVSIYITRPVVRYQTYVEPSRRVERTTVVYQRPSRRSTLRYGATVPVNNRLRRVNLVRRLVVSARSARRTSSRDRYSGHRTDRKHDRGRGRSNRNSRGRARLRF